MLSHLLNSKKSFQVLSGLLFLCCLFLIFSWEKTQSGEINKIIHDQQGYLFTNPILDCEAGISGEETFISRKDANEKVETLKEKYNINFMSVYYRDLNNGPWLGINEKEEFVPASLLKVPLVLSLFKYAEDKEDIFSQKVLVTEKHSKESYPQSINSASIQMEVGKEYTLRDIADRTIKYSDNLGVNLILEHMPVEHLEDLYVTIGGSGVESNVRVKDYASFFRILYNASYLDRAFSEELLKILSETEYRDGIVAGVSDDVIVAHKFGEFTVDEAFDGGLSLSTTEVQLHDCGVIYHPTKPYILCVMTRGTSYSDQEKAIAELSKFFFENIEDS